MTTRAIGYVRCSTNEQADSGLGLRAQRAAIEAECGRRRWELVGVYEDPASSGKTFADRPGLAAALEAVESDAADALLASKLDRLSRSLLDFAGLMERSQRNGFALVALDLGVDTTTPSGRLVASVMASFAEYERYLIGARTKDALAVKRAEGTKLGRPRSLPPKVVRRIVAHHNRGGTLTAIADALNRANVPTAQGGARWYPSTVRAVLSYATATAS